MQPDKILAELDISGAIPGMAVCIQKEGREILRKGYGLSDLDAHEAVDAENTLFRAASASKPIAATALAKLVQADEIDLDASFYEYVPYFPKKAYDFSIRHLASHTAGIRSYKGREYALNKPYTIKESLKIFQEDPLLFEPGTSFHYNSFDWVMLSLAMEEVSGMPFEEFTKRAVLEPLGMLNTIAEDPGNRSEQTAEFYTKWSDKFRKAASVDNRYKLAGGGFLTTAVDLVKLGQAYLDQKVLTERLAREFLTAQMVNERSTYYGLGWEVSRDRKGRSFFGHTGNSVGGYSNFYIYPEAELVIAILINSTDPKVQNVLNEAIDAFF